MKNKLQMLVKGSRNLDKMRKEAHEIVNLIISFLTSKKVGREPDKDWKHRVAMIKTPQGKWTLEDSSIGNLGPVISYYSYEHPNGLSPNYISQNPNGLDKVSAYYVRAFLDELPFLLDLVLREFPEIQDEFNWKVIMNAAEVDI